VATKQQIKSQQTMDELMASALELFEAKGYQDASVADITRKAGYAKGSFYRCWSSKDELFLQILEKKLGQYRQARDERIKSADSLEQALRIIWDFLESMVVDRNWAKIFLEFTVHAARDKNLRGQLAKSQHRLSEDVFARLLAPFVPEGCSAERIGALNTALFEGFMVHNALEIGVLRLEDVREAAVALALRQVRETC
jgi:AcrR family transcriptional regulator